VIFVGRQFAYCGDAMGVMAQQSGGRIGDLGAMVRASRGLDGNEGAEVLDSVTKKRRLVAMFCKMMGEQARGNGGETLAQPPQQPLSPRQRQTLELLLTGNAEKEIARRLAISRHTVHVYVKSLYKCFGVCSRGELLARWVQR
jgi:DNA-binding CsgD family transcriptional regulator